MERHDLVYYGGGSSSDARSRRGRAVLRATKVRVVVKRAGAGGDLHALISRVRAIQG